MIILKLRNNKFPAFFNFYIQNNKNVLKYNKSNLFKNNVVFITGKYMMTVT